jgi:hypothetical protein
LSRLRLSVTRLGALIAGEGIITAENFGALIVLYSETGGHVLTPFLGACLGWQDKVAVRCLQSGLPMRMVADEGEVECDRQ